MRILRKRDIIENNAAFYNWFSAYCWTFANYALLNIAVILNFRVLADVAIIRELTRVTNFSSFSKNLMILRNCDQFISSPLNSA